MDGHHVVAKQVMEYLTIGHDPLGHTKWDGHDITLSWMDQ